MAIRLQFSRQADPISSLIAYYGASPFSHVDAVLPGGQLLGARSDSVGGQPPGVRIRPPGYSKFATRVVFNLECTIEQEGAFYDFLRKQLGKPYDKSAILGFMTGRNWREDDAWICSELVSRAAEMATILPYLYLAASKISPGGAILAFSAIGAKVIEHVP